MKRTPVKGTHPHHHIPTCSLMRGFAFTVGSPLVPSLHWGLSTLSNYAPPQPNNSPICTYMCKHMYTINTLAYTQCLPPPARRTYTRTHTRAHAWTDIHKHMHTKADATSDMCSVLTHLRDASDNANVVGLL